MRRAGLVLFLFLGTACTSVGGVTARSYTRGELSALTLHTIDVVVVAKGPPIATGDTIDVEPFAAPHRTSVLAVEHEDAAMNDALATSLAADLSARGFQVRFLGVTPEVAPAPPVETSTVVTSTLAVTPSTPPPAPGQSRLASSVSATQLASDATLEDVRVKSHADAILVVRTLMVDEFKLHEPSKASSQLPGDTGIPLARHEGRAYAVHGRLLVGQAFLFDRKTGVRLWSRQLPDFPEGGKLLEHHPFLAYGFVAPGNAAMTDAQKASLAAPPFVKAMLREFPRAQNGRPEARASLDAVDVEAELREEQFFDKSKVMLEVQLDYGVESSGTSLTLDGEMLPALGTGAISPNGIIRGGAQIGYLAPGGFAFSLAGRFGRAPASFARAYHRDVAEGGIDRSAHVTIDGATTYAGELGLGYLILLSERLMLRPGGDFFLDVWDLDAAPDNVVDKTTHLRLGVDVDVDLLMSITPMLFTRLGVSGRIGFDTGGPAFGGANLSLGFGLFL